MRRNYVDIEFPECAGVARRRSSAPLPQALAQLHQPSDMKVRSPGRDRDERIHSPEAGPLRWKRPQALVSVLVVDALFTPIGAPLCQFEDLPPKGMERVGYLEGLPRTVTMRCS